MLVSVVIPNYNYERYLGTAIDSALALDWPSVEVIVVDDGSTDGSRAVIEGYGERVRAIYKDNGGQTDACNVGFAACRGELVIFLDSDDVLGPSLMRAVAEVWHPGVAKVQCQMQIIDAGGQPIGTIFPRYRGRPTPERVRHWAAVSGAYPTPPGSGNVYSAQALRRIFPLDGNESASDSYLLAAAPFLGDVVTIAQPLVSYRVHGKNDGAMAEFDASKFGREVQRAAWRFQYSKAVAREAGAVLSDSAFNRSMTTLAYRLASLRLLPEKHPVPEDTIAAVMQDFFRAVLVPQGLSWSGRTALLLWALAVSGMPRAAAERLVTWRFVASQRPRRLRHALAALGLGR